MAAVSIAGDAVATRSRWFQRRPILLFVIVTFLVSYGLGFPALFIAGSWASGLSDVTQLYAGRFFVVIGPTCGALAAVAATSGRGAIASLLRRRLSLSAGWWAPALLLPVVAIALVFFAYAWAGWPPEVLAASLGEAWPLLLTHVALQILIVGLGEELGWRGWLLPNLTARYGLSGATLFTGIIWYIWHFPILLGGAADAFWFALAIGGFSILYSAMWIRSGQSAFLPAVAHGSVNAPVVFLTAVLPDAEHGAAWNILCGMVAACGLGVLLWTRAQWRQAPQV
jgi:membrane protease YdiL (CAAX protease family)